MTADVIDEPQSAVWQQAANRLPTEQAVLYALTSGDWTGSGGPAVTDARLPLLVLVLGGNALLRRGEPLELACSGKH